MNTETDKEAECQKELANGEVKMADDYDILEDKAKITHWSL